MLNINEIKYIGINTIQNFINFYTKQYKNFHFFKNFPFYFLIYSD